MLVFKISYLNYYVLLYYASAPITYWYCHVQQYINFAYYMKHTIMFGSRSLLFDILNYKLIILKSNVQNEGIS